MDYSYIMVLKWLEFCNKCLYYRNILKKLDAKDYRVRCIAVHSLLELVEKEQYSLTKYKLEKRLAIESSFAVKDNIQHALFELDKIQ